METQDLRNTPNEDRRGGRPAAGTDPQKRRQILDGAGRIFSTLGYDAASMSDVAHEAQVSKATLYVYFQDKEHLFTAICAEKRDRNISELVALLEELQEVGLSCLQLVTALNPVVVQRNVIAHSTRCQRTKSGRGSRMSVARRDFGAASTARTSEHIATAPRAALRR